MRSQSTRTVMSTQGVMHTWHVQRTRVGMHAVPSLPSEDRQKTSKYSTVSGTIIHLLQHELLHLMYSGSPSQHVKLVVTILSYCTLSKTVRY